MDNDFDAARETLLDQMRGRRADAKQRMDIAAEEYKMLDEAIISLERLNPMTGELRGVSIMVEANEFVGLKTPSAVAAIMLRNPRPLKKVDIANALERGGQSAARDIHKIPQNVGSTLKSWRRAQMAQLNEADATWTLTGRGRVELSKNAAPRETTASERSLFAGEG